MMRMPQSMKEEIICHLESCLEMLPHKENGYNESEIERLYKLISRVVDEMKNMEAREAVAFFRDNINDNVRRSLQKLNIELVVW